MQEQRRNKRWLIDKSVHCQVNGNVFEGTLKDISLKGARIILYIPQALKRTNVHLTITIVGQLEPLKINCEVTWQKRIDKGRIEIGLYFKWVKDKDREKIYSYVFDYFPQQIIEQWWSGMTQPGQGGRFDQLQGKEEDMQRTDRRLFERFDVDFPVAIRQLPEPSTTQAQCCDVSAGGIKLLSERDYSPNANLELRLEIPDGHEPFHGAARVVWSKQVHENRWSAGLEFNKIDFMGLRRIFELVTQS